jgi:hypothetical protein
MISYVMSLVNANGKRKHDSDSAIESDDEHRSYGQAQNSKKANKNSPLKMGESSRTPEKKTSSTHAQALRPEDDSTADYAFVTFEAQKYRIQGYDHQNQIWTGKKVTPALRNSIRQCLRDRKVTRYAARIWSIEYLLYHRCTPEYAKVVMTSMREFAGYTWDTESWEDAAKILSDQHTKRVFHVAQTINELADARAKFKITTKRTSEDDYRPRAKHYMPVAGFETFEKFENVIDIQKIISKDSTDEDAVEYGFDFLAHACYIEASESTEEDRWIKWKQCQEAKFGDHKIMQWPKEKMEIRDIPELAMAKRAQTLCRAVRVCNGQDRWKKEIEHIKNHLGVEKPALGDA